MNRFVFFAFVYFRAVFAQDEGTIRPRRVDLIDDPGEKHPRPVEDYVKERMIGLLHRPDFRDALPKIPPLDLSALDSPIRPIRPRRTVPPNQPPWHREGAPGRRRQGGFGTNPHGEIEHWFWS